MTRRPCESTRGEWGQRCPDCGEQLPRKPGPMASPGWPSRGQDFPAGSSAGLGDRDPGRVSAYRARRGVC